MTTGSELEAQYFRAKASRLDAALHEIMQAEIPAKPSLGTISLAQYLRICHTNLRAMARRALMREDRFLAEMKEKGKC